MASSSSPARRRARPAPETFPLGYRALRDQLVQDGRLVDDAETDLYRFAVDVTFGSPSVVAARSASGPREWKVRGIGQLYRDWRAAKLGEATAVERA